MYACPNAAAIAADPPAELSTLKVLRLQGVPLPELPTPPPAVATMHEQSVAQQHRIGCRCSSRNRARPGALHRAD
eukprot:869728-Prymnesium_polylepis.1